MKLKYVSKININVISINVIWTSVYDYSFANNLET